jgi:hypothetical protein
MGRDTQGARDVPAGLANGIRRTGGRGRTVTKRTINGGNRVDGTSSSQLDWVSDPMRLDSRTPLRSTAWRARACVSVVRPARPEGPLTSGLNDPPAEAQTAFSSIA